jgi:hypothetical protein
MESGVGLFDASGQRNSMRKKIILPLGGLMGCKLKVNVFCSELDLALVLLLDNKHGSMTSLEAQLFILLNLVLY